MKAEPYWKVVSCPTCGAKAGESCGREALGAPWIWVRAEPHVSRKRLADTLWSPVTPPPLDKPPQ